MKSYQQFHQRKPRFKIQKTQPQGGNTERSPLKGEVNVTKVSNTHINMEDMEKKLKEQGISNLLTL